MWTKPINLPGACWRPAGLLTVSQVARADSLDEQRSYAQIKQAWDNRQMDVVEQMMPGLKNYPLRILIWNIVRLLTI